MAERGSFSPAESSRNVSVGSQEPRSVAFLPVSRDPGVHRSGGALGGGRGTGSTRRCGVGVRPARRSWRHRSRRHQYVRSANWSGVGARRSGPMLDAFQECGRSHKSPLPRAPRLERRTPPPSPSRGDSQEGQARKDRHFCLSRRHEAIGGPGCASSSESSPNAGPLARREAGLIAGATKSPYRAPAPKHRARTTQHRIVPPTSRQPTRHPRRSEASRGAVRRPAP